MQNAYEARYDNDAEDETGSSKIGIFIGAALVVVVAVVLLLIYKASHPPLVPAPSAFTTFVAGDKAFSCDQPVGWESAGSGAGAVESGALFTSGSARIDVTADLAGSLMGDMATAQNNQIENMASGADVRLPPPTPPVEKLHVAGKDTMAAHYQDYSENQMVKFDAKLGEGRVSEFTANGGMFKGPLHGYRATLLSTERRITVVTVCPEANWAILKPVFIREIQSVGHGPA